MSASKIAAAALIAGTATAVGAWAWCHMRHPKRANIANVRSQSRISTFPVERRVLVTGGTGYIGSHTVVQLVQAGYHVTIVDSLVNSSIVSLERVRELSQHPECIDFYQVDLLDKELLDEVFRVCGDVGFVIHFAALKAVGESVQQPIRYYENNLTGTFNLLDCMRRHGCKNIIFSSSATVYGHAKAPIKESSSVGVGITNPYGQTKFMMEQVLRDLHKSDPSWGVVLLRYFNPVGAHESGRIGEDPKGIPNNLMPFVLQVAVGRRERLPVFGNDYDTKDGTGMRDFIHVEDLAAGHLAALRWLQANPRHCDVFNLGTGTAYTVLEMVEAMKRASGRDIPVEIKPRREGDLACVYAEPDKAQRVLGWRAQRGLKEMCEDGWRWQQQNPNGFASA